MPSFIATVPNQREDCTTFVASAENRMRLLLEVFDAVGKAQSVQHVVGVGFLAS